MRTSLRGTFHVMIAALVTMLLTAGSAPPSEACSALTKEDAAAALGEAANGPKAPSGLPAGPGATVSSWEYTGSGYHRVQLNLTRLLASVDQGANRRPVRPGNLSLARRSGEDARKHR